MPARRLVLLALIPASVLAAAESSSTVADIIPITEANLRGHRMLYDEGWYVVTSTRRAFEFAKKASISSSREAIQRASQDASTRSAALGPAIKADVSGAAQTTTEIRKEGARRGAGIASETRRIAGEEQAYASESFQKAMDSFVRGNLSLARRTEEDRRELAAIPGGWFNGLKGDFSDIYERSEAVRRRFGDAIEPAWERSFTRAAADFRAEYERSGTQKNSLLALGTLLRGYLEAFYHGVAAPGARTLVRVVADSGRAVFLPVADSVMVTGRTIQSIGLTPYYAGKMGISVVSPTLEGGLLAAFALASEASIPITYAAGGTLGVLNQVAFTAAAPVAGAGEAAAKATRDTGSYVGFLMYDAASGAMRVTISQAESGIVLGYNALTALPTHALLGTMDAAFFLAWDGPRLMIAQARGRVKAGGHEHSLGALPAGTVTDLGALRKADGVAVETVSTDPAVLRDVLERLPADLRKPDVE